MCQHAVCQLTPNRLATCVLAASLAVASLQAADTVAPLADAAERQDEAAIRVLINGGVDINKSQVDGMTALHWAVYHDNTRTAALLVANGADANAENRYGVRPLSLACTNGNAAVVDLLLDAGADANSTLRGGETVLMTAARTGRLEPVLALLAAGAEVNAKERNGQTALMWAAADGHVEVVHALIDAGADFLDPLHSGFTPLFFAVREGHSDVVLALLEAGADVNSVMAPRSGGRQKRATPLVVAVENGHFETAVALLEAGADPNGSPAGFTALHAITWTRRPLGGDGDPAPIGSGNLSSLDFVRLLLESGADIDAQYDHGESGDGGRYAGGRAQFTNSGSTPFMLAARTSDVPLLKLLLEAGADWQIPNDDNDTPLLAAAGVGALGSGNELPGTENEAIESVHALLELGADINAVADTGETAMHGAAYHERPELVQFLADNGADISIWNQKNKFGWTPLMIARGHRPGNFRPSPKTIVAIEAVMREAAVEIPPEMPPTEDDER